MDGARLFNLPLHSGKSIAEYAALFDTVYVSLWKHFNAASGAMLAGTGEFIEGLYHTRRMFGGSLPHAWPVIAPVMQYVDSYQTDYAKAWLATDQLISMLQASGRFDIRKLSNGTSRFFLKPSGVKADMFYERVSKAGVLMPQANADIGEFAMQVNPSVLRMSPAAIAHIFIGATS